MFPILTAGHKVNSQFVGFYMFVVPLSSLVKAKQLGKDRGIV